MKRPITLFVALAGIVLWIGAGCSKSGGEAESVAQNFWNAMEAKDVEAAKAYCTRESAEGLSVKDDAGDQDVSIAFGEVTKEDGKTFVTTTITTTNEGREMEVPMQTVLVKEDGQLKVDVNATMMSMFGGAMGAAMQQMGDAMKSGMEEMGKSMSESIRNQSDDD